MSPPGSVPASEFWTSSTVVTRLDIVERDVASLHHKMDQMRNRTWTIIGIFGVPLLTLLGGAYFMADSSLDATEKFGHEVKRHETEIFNLQTTQMDIREGIVAIRTEQSNLQADMEEVKDGQHIILDELRSNNGRNRNTR